MNPKLQYLLRVKSGSALDKIMRAMDNGYVTNDELAAIGGQKQWSFIGQWILKMTDNVAVVKDWNSNSQCINYTHPVASTPQSVSAQVTVAAVEQPAQPETPMESIRWPEPPPLIESMGDKYRQPAWFDIMRKMVRNGRHIALAGPPGVGKDTAVQELAAQEGKVLVTVGGDAGFRKRDLIGQPQIARGQSFLD